MSSAGVVGTGAGSSTAPREDDAGREAPALLRILWADPQHMPEHLATWSLARFGPRAAAALERLHRTQPEATRGELEQRVVEHQTRVAATEGAFVGGPFVVLIPVAFCAALLAQAQMVFELAGVAGREPTDGARAAELLVLLGVYPSVADAAEALDALPRHLDERPDRRLPAGMRWAMIRRMAYLLGVVGPADESRSRLRATAGWAGIGVLLLVGLVLPLVWVPYMAYASRRSTLRMGRRARGYYAEGGDAVVLEQGTVEAGGLLAFARVGALVVFPIVFAVVGLVTGFAFVGGRWVSAVVLLLALSAVATLVWLRYHAWRHGRSTA